MAEEIITVLFFVVVLGAIKLKFIGISLWRPKDWERIARDFEDRAKGRKP